MIGLGFIVGMNDEGLIKGVKREKKSLKCNCLINLNVSTFRLNALTWFVMEKRQTLCSEGGMCWAEGDFREIYDSPGPPEGFSSPKILFLLSVVLSGSLWCPGLLR